MVRKLFAWSTKADRSADLPAIFIEPEPNGDGISEDAVTIETYRDIFTMQQRKNSITLNYEAIPDLIKALRLAKEQEI